MFLDFNWPTRVNDDAREPIGELAEADIFDKPARLGRFDAVRPSEIAQINNHAIRVGERKHLIIGRSIDLNDESRSALRHPKAYIFDLHRLRCRGQTNQKDQQKQHPTRR